MIEKTLISYLTTTLDGVHIGMEAPSTKPSKYVVLKKLDASVVNHINNASIGVECYGETLLQTAELSELVKTALFNAITLDSISGVSLGGESTNINTNIKAYCYECVFNFYYY